MIEYRKSLSGVCFFKIIDKKELLEVCKFPGREVSHKIIATNNSFSLDCAINPMLSTESTKEEFEIEMEKCAEHIAAIADLTEASPE